MSYCKDCGAPVNPGAAFCPNCGRAMNDAGAANVGAAMPEYPQAGQAWAEPAQAGQAPQVERVVVEHQYVQAEKPRDPRINPAWPVRSKLAAGLLALLLGSIGIHKFYLGKTGMGVLYLLFCWTGIPAIAGLVEGIIYLCDDDVTWQLKHEVRIE